jgi:hypothetical protein
MLKARGLTVIGALISSAGGEGAGGHDLFLMEVCNGGLHQLLEQGLLS